MPYLKQFIKKISKGVVPKLSKFVSSAFIFGAKSKIVNNVTCCSTFNCYLTPLFLKAAFYPVLSKQTSTIWPVTKNCNFDGY